MNNLCIKKNNYKKNKNESFFILRLITRCKKQKGLID
jgi:hypothetical protein